MASGTDDPNLSVLFDPTPPQNALFVVYNVPEAIEILYLVGYKRVKFYWFVATWQRGNAAYRRPKLITM